MKVPLSTYRIQFTPSFTFEDAEKILDYLKIMGISDIYASPILKSKSGSHHGYDQVDFKKIDCQLGGKKGYYELMKKIKQVGFGWLQDIVPNHMAYHTSNAYIYDVLEKGGQSVYGEYFDIDWHNQEPELNGKLLFPFLEKKLDKCLQEGIIKLDYQNKSVFIRYHDFFLPLSCGNFNQVRTPHL